MSVTSDEFNNYHVSVPNLNEGIKHDLSLFTFYQVEKQWDTWQCSMFAQACAQDVTKVFDGLNKPTTAVDKELFVEKQKFMPSLSLPC
jgi:hypothetical protein